MRNDSGLCVKSARSNCASFGLRYSWFAFEIELLYLVSLLVDFLRLSAIYLVRGLDRPHSISLSYLQAAID